MLNLIKRIWQNGETVDADKMNTISTDLDTLNTGKIDEPETAGTENQVLSIDSLGRRIWRTVTGGSSVWGQITGILSNQTDLQGVISALNADIADKQDKLIAGQNIQIAADGKTISATGGGGGGGRNLLDNPFFTVNQRGATTYTVGAYGVDRWKLISGSATVSNNQITLNGTLRQIREFSLGRNDFVCSARCASGTATVSYDDTTKYFDIVSSGGVIEAVKLEIGTTSTLANDTVPNYAEELAKCQRYYWQAGPNQANVVLGLGVAQVYNGVNGFSSLPVPLRAYPVSEYNHLVVYDGQNIIDVSTNPVIRHDAGVTQWVFGAAGVTIGKAYNLILIGDDSYLKLSADL